MSKTLIGIVASDKASKTIVISVATRKTHPLYKKQYTETRRFMAHDETEEARIGDKVAVIETRPLSKRKRFTLERVIERAPVRHVEEEPSVASHQSPAKGKTKSTEDKRQAATVPKEMP